MAKASSWKLQSLINTGDFIAIQRHWKLCISLTVHNIDLSGFTDGLVSWAAAGGSDRADFHRHVCIDDRVIIDRYGAEFLTTHRKRHH